MRTPRDVLRCSARRARRLGTRSSGKPFDSQQRDEHARRIAALATSLGAGLDVWAKYAREPRVAELARKLARTQRALAEDALMVAQASRPGVRTCERMRWEWLASTAMLLDGTPETRLRAECLRLASEARDLAAWLERSSPSCAASRRLREAADLTRERLLRSD